MRPRAFSFFFVAVGIALLPILACSSTPSTSTPSDGLPTDPALEGNGETGPGETEESPEAPADCRMLSSWDAAPSSVCSTSAATCIANAKTSAAASACIENESSCAGCFSDVMLGCLVGTAGKPGPCAGAAGCVDGCVASVCGAKPTAKCRATAVAGSCLTVSKKLDACLANGDQKPCMERFRNECLPKASCGNNVVEAGEACDGACPSSCPTPPAGDLCSTYTLKGSAATCSATCEKQSKCPAGCPANTTPSSVVGIIDSGTALPSTSAKVSFPSLASIKATGCPSTTANGSRVIAWKAPAAGLYTFKATCSVTWTSYGIGTGQKFDNALECVRRVAIVKGAQCAATADATACSLDVDNSFKQGQMPDKAVLAPMALAAGEEVLVAVDFGLANPLPPTKTNTTYNGQVSAQSWSLTAGTCTPQCAGKSCGGDGCGGTCGTCSGGSYCTTSGQCQAVCVPSCAGKVCGSDGCGGSCGTCGAGLTCDGSQCKPACVPNCAGKQCGSNGCGGTCGTCGINKVCSATNQCVLSGPCDPVSNVGCASPNQCITLANESNQCVLMGTGEQGDPCADSAGCRGGHACFAGTCRKVCDKLTGSGCGFGESCASVAGWFKYGTCN